VSAETAKVPLVPLDDLLNLKAKLEAKEAELAELDKCRRSQDRTISLMKRTIKKLERAFLGEEQRHGKTKTHLALEQDYIATLKEAIKGERERALQQVLELIDSQTHTSELGDPYRHMRSLVETLQTKETQ